MGYLVLSRRVGEKVHILSGDDVIVMHVVGVTQHGQFKLAFNAPANVKIHREEIIKRIEKFGNLYDDPNPADSTGNRW